MNKSQKNHLTMNKVTESFLKEKETKYKDLEALKDLRSELKLKNDEIETKDDERENISKGTVSEKTAAKDAAAETAVAIAGRLYAYAKKTNNITLMEKTDVTRTKLLSLRNIEFPIVVKSIKELAEANLSDLSRYGITAEKIAVLGKRLSGFLSASENKDTSGASKSGTYVSLTQLFRESDDIIDSIDKLMEEYNETDLEFYSGYKAARVIRDAGTKHGKDAAVKEGGRGEQKS